MMLVLGNWELRRFFINRTLSLPVVKLNDGTFVSQTLLGVTPGWILRVLGPSTDLNVAATKHSRVENG